MMSLSRVSLRLLSGARHKWVAGRRAHLCAIGLRLKSSAAVESVEGPEPPNGFLFNEKPLLPGEKRQKEDWENVWYFFMGINFLIMVAIGVLKPDTSLSSWGRQKALERLAEKDALATNTDTDSEE